MGKGIQGGGWAWFVRADGWVQCVGWLGGRGQIGGMGRMVWNMTL